MKRHCVKATSLAVTYTSYALWSTLLKRYGEPERRSRARCALDTYMSFVALDDLSGDEEAKAKANPRPAMYRKAGDAVKPIPDLHLLCGRQAGALIAHRDACPPATTHILLGANHYGDRRLFS